MLRFSRLAGMLAAALFALMWVMPAQAQATRTWISGVGDDVNPCSRTAPCKTFPGAISKTAAGGEIDCLDPGGFGGVTVTKAITLDCGEGAGEGGILVAGTNGVTVNCSTDPNCVVVLDGLQIDGGPTGSNSLNGVKFIAGKALEINHCWIRNFTGGSPNGHGVNFAPSSGTARLFISDTIIMTNGQLGGGVGNGVLIAPTGSANATFVLTNMQALNNDGNGVKVDLTGLTTGSMHGTIARSSLSGNVGGLTVITSGATQAPVTVDNSTISNNSAAGIVANGTNVNVFLGRSVLSGNGIAFGIPAGRINSYGDNDANGNVTGSSPSSPTIPHS